MGKKLNLSDLNIKSFITSAKQLQNILGGNTEEETDCTVPNNRSCIDNRNSGDTQCATYPGDICGTIQTQRHTYCINGNPGC